MTDEEIKDFEKDWEEKWNPQNASPQGCTSYPAKGEEAVKQYPCNDDYDSCLKHLEVKQTSKAQDDPAHLPAGFRILNSTLSEGEQMRDSGPYQFNIRDIKRTFVTDQELAVDGIILREKRELTDLDNESNSLLVHTRWIGTKSYQVTKTVKDGKQVDTQVNSDMTDEEKAKFDLELNEKRNPELSTATATKSYPSAINLVSDSRKTMGMVTDQQLVVDGVSFRNRREMTDLDTDGNSLLVHTRWIGKNTNQITKTLKGGKEVDKKVNTNMNDTDFQKFKMDWADKWNPNLAQPTKV